jgi:hypothetical protein
MKESRIPLSVRIAPDICQIVKNYARHTNQTITSAVEELMIRTNGAKVIHG